MTLAKLRGPKFPQTPAPRAPVDIDIKADGLTRIRLYPPDQRADAMIAAGTDDATAHRIHGGWSLILSTPKPKADKVIGPKIFNPGA